jgi:hypothetical protein
MKEACLRGVTTSIRCRTANAQENITTAYAFKDSEFASLFPAFRQLAVRN